MNDITALMATMKAAAELIAPGYKRNWIVSHDDETCWVGANDDDGNLTPFIEVSIGDWSDNKTDNERLAAFIALAHPANVLALVEALEKAQQELGAAKTQITKLERQWEFRSPTPDAYDAACKALEKHRQRADKAEASLESRTVTVKLIDVRDHLADVSDKTLALAFRRLAEGVRDGDVAAMRAAGIQVIEGEQKNG